MGGFKLKVTPDILKSQAQIINQEINLIEKNFQMI